jgi:hypothetical protein
MADPLVNDDIVRLVPVTAADIEFSLTVFFNGGPITVSVKEFDKAGPVFPDDPPRVTTFSADPFFRKTNWYVASGAMLFRFVPPGPVSKSTLVTVGFTNMFTDGVLPAPGAHFRVQLTSPANPLNPRTFDVAGDLAAAHTQNVVIAITQ